MADESLLPPPSPLPVDPSPVAEEAAYDPFEWTAERKKLWKNAVDKALELQSEYHKWWDKALKNYAPRVQENPDDYELEPRTNRAFAIVERKRADMFYQRPDVTIVPSLLLQTIPGNAEMSSAHAAIMNHKLGQDGVNVKTLARDVIFANELFGAGWSKIFYRAYTQNVEQQMRDEMGQPLSDEFGQPVMESVPVVLKAECGWEPFSNKQALIPHDFRSTDFDKAPWLGMRFTMSLRDARSQWADKIPKDFKGSTSGNGKAQFFASGAQPEASQATDDVVTGSEIYYRSRLFRDDVVHPDRLTRLVLIDGIDAPVEERDSPDQTVDAQGRLTPDSMIGYPFHALVIRTLTDSAFIMSDVAVALPSTQEMDKYRKQGVIQRDINNTRYVYNTGVIPEQDMRKILTAPQGWVIGLPNDAFNSPDGGLRPLASVPIPSDNYAMARELDHDLAMTFAIDATSAGTNASGSQTATESNLRQANVNVRQGSEQGCVADWYTSGVKKLSTLVQKWLSVEDVEAIVGKEHAQLWDAWRKAIPAPLAFEVLPDSSLRNDTPLDRMQWQTLFSYVANDPTINRRYFLERLMEKFHADPSKALLKPEQMPKKEPEKPSLALSFKGEDLSPLSPQSPIVLDILIKSGMQLDPAALQIAQLMGQQAAQRMVEEEAAKTNGQPAETQTKHGGMLPRAEPLNKHQADLTGGMQNTGEVMPGMSTGGIQ